MNDGTYGQDVYKNLSKKIYPISPRFIKDRGRGQNMQMFRQSNNWRGNRSFSRDHNNRGYVRGRGNFRKGNF